MHNRESPQPDATPLRKEHAFASGDNRWRASEAFDYFANQDEADANFRARIPAIIRTEQAEVDAQIEAGRVLVANPADSASPLIHTVSCAAMRHRVERSEAWANYSDDHRGDDGVYPMPRLISPEDVERLPSYRACQLCNPDVASRRKMRAPSLNPTRLRNITRYHLGRRFQTIEGEELGELQEFTVTVATTALRFTGGSLSGGDDDKVVMLPKYLGA